MALVVGRCLAISFHHMWKGTLQPDQGCGDADVIFFRINVCSLHRGAKPSKYREMAMAPSTYTVGIFQT